MGSVIASVDVGNLQSESGPFSEPEYQVISAPWRVQEEPNAQRAILRLPLDASRPSGLEKVFHFGPCMIVEVAVNRVGQA